MDNSTLRILYDLIKSEFPKYNTPEWNEILLEGNTCKDIKENFLPSDFPIKFYDLGTALKKLDELKLIKSSGKLGYATITDPVTQYRKKVRAYSACLLPSKDLDSLLPVNEKPQNNVNANNKKYWIDWTKNRDVILNDKYVINTMQLDRVSDCWFDYIFNNPNKKITLQEISKAASSKCSGGFNKFLNNIKFKGQLRKLFFKQGKTGIIFHNPITEEEFEKRKEIDTIELNKEIEKLTAK